MFGSSNSIKILIIALVISAIALIGELVYIVWTIAEYRKNGNKEKLKHNLLSLLLVAIAASSWLLNFGWIRFVSTIMMLPFLHAIIFFAVGDAFSKHNGKSKWYILYYVSYIISYFVMPDVNGADERFVFFKLISNGKIAEICKYICIGAISVNIVTMIIMIVHVFKRKHKSLG